MWGNVEMLKSQKRGEMQNVGCRSGGGEGIWRRMGVG